MSGIQFYQEYVFAAGHRALAGEPGTPSLGYPESTLLECTCPQRPHHERCPARRPRVTLKMLVEGESR